MQFAWFLIACRGFEPLFPASLLFLWLLRKAKKKNKKPLIECEWFLIARRGFEPLFPAALLFLWLLRKAKKEKQKTTH
jgi:hypothetical protein